jgi:hypothetical protein
MTDETVILERLAQLESRAIDRMVDLDARMREIEHRGADGYSRSHGRVADSLVTRLRKSDQLAALLRHETRSAVIDLAGIELRSVIAGDTGSPPEPGNVHTDPARRPGVSMLGMRQRRVLDLFPAVPVDSNAAIATRETLLVEPTAGQAHEGAAKPSAGIVYDAVERPVVTVAAHVTASRQVLADSPALESAIRSRLLNMLLSIVERQMLVGAGGPGEMSGLTSSGNHSVFTPTSGDTALDSIRRARTLVELADFVPRAVVLHPADWEGIELGKTSQGVYVAGEGAARFVESGLDGAWRMEVVLSRSMPIGKLAVLDPGAAGYVADRQQATLEVGFVNDNFTRNLVTLLAELRAALVVVQPGAIRYGDLVA